MQDEVAGSRVEAPSASPADLPVNDHEAWDLAVSTAIPRLMGFALAHTQNRQDAEDSVAEAVTRAYQSQHTFRGTSTVTAWLYAILRNVLIDRSRRAKDTVSLDDVDSAWVDPQFSVDPEAVALASESRDELMDALTRLPDSYRVVVVLHDIEEWTVAEIAQTTGTSEGSVWQRLRRARLALVHELAGAPGRRRQTAGVPLDCWSVRQHLSDFIDQRVDDETAAAMTAHLERCPTCPPLVTAAFGVRASLSRLRDSDRTIGPALADRLRTLSHH